MRCSIAMLCLALCWQFAWEIQACRAQGTQKEPPKETEKEQAKEAANAAAPAAVQLPQRIMPAQPVQVVEGMRALPLFRAAPANPFGASSGLQFDLRNLVLAKYDEGSKGPQIVALVEQTRMETKTVKVTTLRQEVRTRKVKVKDTEGKEKEIDQDYTVSIPETRDMERAVPVAVGKKPTAFAFDTLRVYKLDGSKVTAAEAKLLLEKTTPVFLLRGFTGDIKPVEGVYLQAINPNCLIIATEPEPAAEFLNAQRVRPPAIEIRKADDPFAGE